MKMNNYFIMLSISTFICSMEREEWPKTKPKPIGYEREQFYKKVSPLVEQLKELASKYNVTTHYEKVDPYLFFIPSTNIKTLLRGRRSEVTFDQVKLANDMKRQQEVVADNLCYLLRTTKNQYQKALKEQTGSYSQLSHRIRKLKREKEIIDKDLAKTREDLKNKVPLFAQEYRINLMPSGDLAPVLNQLLEALNTDKELQKLIYSIGVLVYPDYKFNDGIFPRIIIFPTAGRLQAQQALDKIFNLFKNVQGLNITPDYNARVNDLIWVSQGDPQEREEEYPYFQGPGKIYYNPNFTGIHKEYFLRHPETGEKLD